LAGAFVVYNVAQQAPEAVKSAGADALTNPVNTSLTTLTDGAWVIDVMNQGGAGTFTTTQSGQTLRWQTSCGTSTLGSSTKSVSPPGSTTLGWSHSGPKRYAHALAAFAPAAPPPPTTSTVEPTTTTTVTTTLPPQTTTTIVPTTTLPPPTTTTLAGGCNSNPQCNDGNACTTDTCNAGTCQHADVSAACNDGAFCNGVETCSPASGCQAGTPPVTNDGIACTTDACNEATDTITHTPNNAACSDGAFCNGAETCSATLGCQAGTPPATSDGIACTTDACNEATDTITHTPNNAACSDGAFCNGAETCSASLGCQAGTPPATSDGIACTTDACNEATDTITHTPNNAACDDANACTSDVCSAVSGCSNTDTCTPHIQLDAASLKSACGGTAADTLTIANVPVPSLPNRMLVVTVGAEENDADCNMAHADMVVSYAGQRLTLAISALSGTTSWRSCNGVFYLLNPPAGTANVSITFPARVGNAIDVRDAACVRALQRRAAGAAGHEGRWGDREHEPRQHVDHDADRERVGRRRLHARQRRNVHDDAGGQTLRWQETCGVASSAGSTKEAATAGRDHARLVAHEAEALRAFARGVRRCPRLRHSSRSPPRRARRCRFR
jgi:hypothetical protein